jgi:hypothetical protein
VNIPRFRSENIGSALKIELAPYYAFSVYKPDAKTTIRNAGLVFGAGHNWTSVYCTPETMGLQVDESFERAGKVYTAQIVGFIPGEDLEAAEPLLLFDTIPVIAKIFTANGKIRIAGSPDKPLMLTASLNTGIIPDTRAGRSFLLTGQHHLPPYYFI